MDRERRRFLGAAIGAGAGAAMGLGFSSAAGAREGTRAFAPLRILILGGTAFLGPEIVEAARRRGHVLTLFNRGKTNPALFPDVEKLRGDRDGDLKALEGRRWDSVVDTSGYVPRVVSASAELLAPSVKQYVFISSISVYAESIQPGTDEAGALATVENEKTEDIPKHYGALKALSEKAAERALPGRVCNIRPGLIVGPRDPTDRFTYWPVRLADGGEVLAPGDGSDPVQFVDVRDLAAWIVSVLERRLTGTFNATGPEKRLTIRKFLEGCRRTVRSRARLVWVPVDFLKKRKVEPWDDLPVWEPWRGGTYGMSSVHCGKAIAAGLRFRPVSQTTEDTLAWFRGLPGDRRAKLRAGLSREREAEVLKAWSEAEGEALPAA